MTKIITDNSKVNTYLLEENELLKNKLDNLIAKNYNQNKQLILSGDVSSATKCNHKSQRDKLPYLKWFEFADNEIDKGREQKRCPNCFKWLFPSEI